jgi:tetratricopeptide (TPR) repeat protein
MHLAQALDEYATRLASLESEEPDLPLPAMLELLTLRDKIQILVNERRHNTGNLLLRLYALDTELRDRAERIYSVVNLGDWHSLIHPQADDWWWYLEEPPFTHWTVRFDWLWNTIAVIWLIAAIALSIDVGRRFLSISPDTLETFAVLGEGSIALLAAGGALTIAGRKISDRLLRSMGVPVRFLQEAKAVVAILLLVGLIWLRISLPAIAHSYNNRGVARQQAGQLTLALRDFSRALALDPGYIEAHYNLGLVNEDMGDFEEAAIQYRIATRGGLDLAFINLARLYIINQNYPQAASLLELRLVEAKEADVRYDMLKNLGWARIGQGRYDEAITRLNQALELRSDLAPAYCLIAQAYEGEQQPEEAMKAWEQCLAYASVFRPDEDDWISMAKQRFAVPP